MKVDIIQTSFVSGELAPALYGRTDIAQYANAAKIVENFIVRPYGSLISTPGTEYINACKTGGSTGISRLIEFIFSRSDSYMIEMGVGYFRFYTDGAVVVSSGSTPFEISHTYTESELEDIHYAQLNDVIYLAHPNHAPAKLTRLAANSWALTALGFTGGPFARDNAIYSNSTTSLLTSATITPSATGGSITLSASSNIFIPSSSTMGHKNTFWKVGATVTSSTTGLDVQGFVQITAVTNPSTATATVVSRLASTAATTIWAQGSWSDVLGWPARVTFHEKRLFFARTVYQPQNIWGSQPFSYENYAINSGEDNDALDIQLASTESNDIKWLASGDKLVAGTYGGDFAIGSGDDSPLTPANTNAKKQTIVGSESIQPKRIGSFLYYIQRFSVKLRELFYLFDNNIYKSVDKTILSPHIAGNTGFKNIVYQQNPDTVLWALRSDGTIATLTREIDQEVQGWARQTTDGYYESIASIPSQDGPHDEIWVIVRRNINGSDVRYVERFKSQLVPSRQEQCFYVHSGLSYDAYANTAILTSTSMSFNYPNSTTKMLLHANGSSGSTSITESANFRTVTVNGNAQISTSVKKFGTGSLYLPNVLGNDSYTKLLAHVDNNVTDSSSSAKTIVNTNVTFSSTTKKFGGYSAYFNGTTAHLATADGADFNYGTGEFAIDLWVYPTSAPATRHGVFGQYTSSSKYHTCSIFPAGDVQWSLKDTTSGIDLNLSSATSKINFGTWNHISCNRNGTTFSLRVNGVLSELSPGYNPQTSALAAPSSAGDLFIGKSFDDVGTIYYFPGYIDEIRVSKGIARYSSDFTPASFAYSSTGDYITLADNVDWSFGTGNFTIDCQAYFNDLSTEQIIIGQYADASNLWHIKKDADANGNKLKVYFRIGGVDKASYVMTNSWSASIGTFYHLAVIRSSSTVRIYIDGVSQTLTETTAISTNDVGDVSALLVIGQQNSSSYFTGYLDEIRIVKGSAEYTSDFTPPVSEHTQTGTTALVTTSAAYFSSGNVGNRLRAIDADGNVLGQMTISGYTSSTIVIGQIISDFDSFEYAAGYWGISVDTISGLGHLEGESISILADGMPEDRTTVSSGTINLSSDFFYVTAGLPYTQTVDTLPKEAGSQRGTAQGKKQRINEVAIKLNRSYTGFSIGQDTDSLSVQTALPSLYTGIISNIYFRGDYLYGAEVVIRNSDPLPMEILSLISSLDTQDK